MDSDKINRWLTLGANLGVVVGIAFLVVEIRQNTTALEAGAYQARSDALQDLSMRVAESEVLATMQANMTVRSEDCGDFERNCELFNDEYFENLSPTEYQQYKRYLLANLFRMDTLRFQYELGLLTSEYDDQSIIGLIEYYLPLWERFDIWQRGRWIEYMEKLENR
jgi:hypothetical protein